MTSAEQRGLVQPSFYPWSPLPLRPANLWPNGSRLAVSVIVALDHVDETLPGAPYPAFRPAGGLGVAIPEPDLPLLTHREYGVRVGIFRILKVVEELSLRPTIAVDVMTAEQCPFVVEHCLNKGADLVAHGISARRLITSSLSEADERAYIGETMSRLFEATGRTITGWLSPSQSESERTPLLLPHYGLRYVCDWSNDDWPYPMSGGSLVSIPVLLPLDDAYCMLAQQQDPEEYATMLIRCARALLSDAGRDARCMVFVIRPWVSGQPFRIRSLASALEAIVALDGVWPCSTGELADAARIQEPEESALEIHR